MKYLAVIRFEFQKYLRVMVIWGLAWMLMAAMMVSFYDAMADNQQEFANLYQAMPQEIMAAFSIDFEQALTFERYLNMEFMVIYLLAGSIFTLYLGIDTIGAEITRKSLVFALSKPLSRIELYFSKALALIVQLVLLNTVVIYSTGVAGELLSEKAEVTWSLFGIFTIAVCIFQVMFLSLGIVLGVVWDSGKALGIGIVLTIFTFFLNILESLPDAPDWLQYINPYSYIDQEYIVAEAQLKTPEIFVLLGFTFVLLAAGALSFSRRSIDS